MLSTLLLTDKLLRSRKRRKTTITFSSALAPTVLTPTVLLPTLLIPGTGFSDKDKAIADKDKALAGKDKVIAAKERENQRLRQENQQLQRDLALADLRNEELQKPLTCRVCNSTVER